MTKRSHASFRHVWIAAAACSLLAGTSSAAAPELQQFDAYLLQGYRQMVEVAARKPGNAALASHFAERSAMAARVGPIEPEALEGRQLDSWTLREAGFARRQLVARLEEGARQRQPLLAAIAQVNFDCWVAASPRRPGPPDADECRRRFYFAFAGLAPGDQPVPTPSVAPAAVPQFSAAAPASPVITVEPLPPPQPRAPAPPSQPAGTLTTPAMQWLAAQGSAAPSPQAIQQQPVQQWAASGSQAAICGPSSPNCETPAFTGPAADALIYDLREVGADRQSGTGAGAGLGNSNARSALGAGGSAIGGNNGNSGSGASTGSNSGAGTSSGSAASGSAGGGSGGSSPSGTGTATGSAQSTASTASGATGGAQSGGSTATGTAAGSSQSTASTSSGTGGVSGAVNKATDAAASAVNDAAKAVDTAVHDIGNAVSGAVHDLGKKLGK